MSQSKIANHKNGELSRQRARDLRKSASIVERLLKQALSEQIKLFDVRFRFQHPIDPYIVDFACLAAKLVVEIDGMSHDLTIAHDEKRERFLQKQGFTIRHYTNSHVIEDAAAIAFAMCEEAHRLQMNRWNKAKDPTPNLQGKFDPPSRGGCASGVLDSQ